MRILHTMMRITAVAKGRVQGVGYREFVLDCAHKTGIVGYVRNTPDGTVKIVAEGSKEALETFTHMIRAGGDPIIRVDSLQVVPGAPSEEFLGFVIRW